MKYIYHGATHIHSTYSDGTFSIKEIAKAAKKAGLSWIIITDHNSLEGFENSEEGWYNGVAVIIGEEVSPDLSDHYLAFGIKEKISPDMPPQEYIQQVTDQGGIGFVAHPDENSERKSGHKALRWTDWSIRGFDGVEIWNQLSDWTDNYDPKNPLYHFFWRNHTLGGPTPKVLSWWDELNNETDKIVPAIGGVDLHALKYNYFGINLKIFPYKSSFKTITNTLFLNEKLSSDFESAKGQILTALKNGNNLISNRYWSRNLKMPLIYIEDKEHRVYPGGSIKLSSYSRLIVNLPKKALLRVLYDGQLIWEFETSMLDFNKLDVGKYRIEAYYKGKPWLFSNPIIITK